MGNVMEQITRFFTEIGGMALSFLPTLLLAIVILVVGLIATKLILGIVEKAFDKHNLDKAARGLLRGVLKVILLMVVIMSAASVLGIPISTFIAVLSAVGLAISLSLKDSLSNIAGGILLIITHPFKAGDVITCGGETGVVEEIGLVYTTIITVDNKKIYLTNNQASSSTIVNVSAMPTRRLDMEFSIAYGADYDKACQLILDIISKNELALTDPAPAVRMSAHNASSIDIGVKVWVNSGDYFALKGDLLEDVKAAFDANGISIPFPQLEVTLNK
ncbi:MAG: mechanosensitive ion channel [Oscillospiraceae bacterium]|nr:mechanosensitive ion channel [Oscillospiraceae bacterium]